MKGPCGSVWDTLSHRTALGNCGSLTEDCWSRLDLMNIVAGTDSKVGKLTVSLRVDWVSTFSDTTRNDGLLRVD